MTKIMGKKIFSMVLALSMIMCSCVLPVGANTASDVVFELNAAALDAQIEGSNGTLTKSANIATGSFVNLAGDTVSYITPADEAVSPSKLGANLTLTGESVKGLTSYTVEVWARYEKPAAETQTGLFAQYATVGDSQKRVMSYVMAPTYHGYKQLGNDNSYSGANTVSTSAAVEDVWSHYVFTVETTKGDNGYTSFTRKGYLNGALKNTYSLTEFSTDATAILDGADSFRIAGVGGYGFSGDIARFKIYNTVKTDTEVSAMYSGAKNDFIKGLDITDGDVLVDIDPLTRKDRSANEIAITQKGTVTNGSFINKAGEVVSYMTTGTPTSKWTDGTSGAFRITDENVAKLKDYTIELWAKYKKPTVEVSPRMFTQRVGAKVLMGYEMGGTASRPHKFVWYDGNSMVNCTSADALTDAWHHYVFTFDTTYAADGTTITGAMPILYIDGAQKAKPGNAYASNLAYIGTADAFTLCGDTGSDGAYLGLPADVAVAKIYKGVKTANEVSTMYANTKADFEEAVALRPSVGEFSVDLGKDIATIGEVKLEKVDEDGNLTAVKGGTYAAVSADDARTLNVKFGMLDSESTYKLTICAGLSFANGTTLDEDKVLTFDTGKAVLVDTEFDGYTTDNYTENFRLSSTGSPVSFTTVTVQDPANGEGATKTDTVLKFKPSDPSATSRNQLYFDLPEPITKTEVLKVEQKTRQIVADSTKSPFIRMMRVVDTEGVQMPNNNSGYALNNSLYYDNTIDKFVDAVSTISYGNDTGKWVMARASKNGYTDSATALSADDVASIMLLEMRNTEEVENYLELSSFKAEVGIVPDILNVSYNGDKTVKVVLNDDMAAVSADTVKLLSRTADSGDVEVEVEGIAYDANTRTATITLSKKLSNGDYLVNITDAVSPIAGQWTGYDIFNVNELVEPEFTSVVTFKAGTTDIQENAAIPVGTTSLTATVTLNNTTAASESVVLIAALYNASNKLEKVTAPVVVENIAANGGSASRELVIDQISTAAGAKMKVFIWNSLADIIPEFEACGLGTAE